MVSQLQSEIFNADAAVVVAGMDGVETRAELKQRPLPTAKAAKKKLIRRADRDYSQALRRGYQFAFFLMNVWLGGQFYLWVRHYETAGMSAYVSHPADVED